MSYDSEEHLDRIERMQRNHEEIVERESLLLDKICAITHGYILDRISTMFILCMKKQPHLPLPKEENAIIITQYLYKDWRSEKTDMVLEMMEEWSDDDDY